ncbi:hypothetical protein D3C81_2200650 [compost metagenome]
MVDRPRISCTYSTTRIIRSEALPAARTRASVRRRRISPLRPMKQSTPKKPPETIASSCFCSVLIRCS